MASWPTGIQAPATYLAAAQAAETIPGLNEEQRLLIAVAVARDGLSYSQATAKWAPRAPASVTAAHQAAITAIANTKNSAHPQLMELVR